MDSVHLVSHQDEQAFLTQLETSREKLASLTQDLRALDYELEELVVERQQHELLHEVCGALEKLAEQGAADLFWGERVSSRKGEEHVRLVRSRLDVFHRQLNEIERSRCQLVEQIELEQENAGVLEYEVLDAQEREEQRKLEWIVERETSELSTRIAVMPWTRGGEDDVRFRKSLAASLLLSLLLGLVLPIIDLPLLDRFEVIEVPERLTRLIREERALPPPPPVQQQQEPEEVVSEPVEEAPLLAEKPTPKPAAQPTRPGPKGILAFKEKFAGLAKDVDAPLLGAQARISGSGEVASGHPARALVTTQATGSSGGINLAALSRDVGGTGNAIAGVEVTQATSSIGSIGAGTDRPLSGSPAMARTDEEIQIVFDRYKSALYRLYNRELRKNPTLKGQMVLRFTIEPDGSVSLCELHSSDMNAPQLSSQVVARVGSFNFGAKDDIPAITILYPIDFLPAT